MTTDPDSIAIAFVVESSLAVAQDWRIITHDYTKAIMTRLIESHPGCRPKMAFVSYGPPDTAPSPILCKRFFTDTPLIFKEMVSEDPTVLGVGVTDSGAGRGMAALDGLIAALELFDILLQSPPPFTPRDGPGTRNYLSHMIHIASSSPDGSKHPSWNDTTAMDDLDWDSLPIEIKKRNIQLTTISVHAKLPRFSELHAASVTGGTSPWFATHPSHTLLLGAFPVSQTSGLSTKRPNEGTIAERPPENKKPRLQPAEEEPKVIPKSEPTPQLQPQPLPPNPPQNQPARPTPTAGPSPATDASNLIGGRFTREKVMEHLQSASQYLQKLDAMTKAAKAEGNTDLAEKLQVEYTQKKDMQNKLMQAVASHARKQSQQQTSALANPPQPQAIPKQEFGAPMALNNGSTSVFTGNLPNPQLNLATTPDARNAAQLQQSQSDAIFPTNMVNVNSNVGNQLMPASTAVQMQKMVEHQQRLRAGAVASHSMMDGFSNQNVNPPGARQDGPMRYPAVAGPSQSLSQPEQPTATPKGLVWSGSMIWSGMAASGKKEFQTMVYATATNAVDCRSDTWPQALTLVPAREPVVSMPELQAWMQRHRPALATFQPQSQVPDSKTNEYNYLSLVQLLTAKKIYATAAWTTPSGGQGRNVLVFPFNGGLAGAFFPLTGMPELPKPSQGLNPQSLPQNMLAHLQQLDPERRNMVMAQFIRHRQLAAQQQQGYPAPGGVQFNPGLQTSQNHATMNAALNMMNSQNQGAGVVNMNNSQASGLPLVGMNNAGGVQGGMNYELLQSMMQRNADGA